MGGAWVGLVDGGALRPATGYESQSKAAVVSRERGTEIRILGDGP
jgi:hypothetical protein